MSILYALPKEFQELYISLKLESPFFCFMLNCLYAGWKDFAHPTVLDFFVIFFFFTAALSKAGI